MPLYKNVPEPSGRMGLIWSLAAIYDSAVIEYGSMGHMLYAQKWMNQTGLIKYGELISTHLSEKDIALGITRRAWPCQSDLFNSIKCAGDDWNRSGIHWRGVVGDISGHPYYFI